MAQQNNGCATGCSTLLGLVALDFVLASQDHAARDNANTVDQHTLRSCPNHRRPPQRAIHPGPSLPLLELTLSFTPVP